MKRNFPYHLCQPDEEKSCSACCGIYNFVKNDKNSLILRLKTNTLALKESSPEDHSKTFRILYNGKGKLFETIFNCEFVGFLDKDFKRVGCLLHPSQNGGRDLRDLSFYGSELCEGHFCLSYYYLTSKEQELVIRTIDDWYLYGLTITDIDLVKGVFQVLSDSVGEAIDPLKVSKSKRLTKIVRSFFELKLRWKFRDLRKSQFGKYLFKGEEYEEIEIPYQKLGRKKSPYHFILLSYGSSFKNSEELDEAESIIERKVKTFSRIYRCKRS